MQNVIVFPRAGDGIASTLCISLINFISLQTLTHRQSDSTTAASPEPCTHSLFNNKVRYIAYFIIILFLYHCARFAPVLPLQKKWQAPDVFVIFFWSGRRDSDPRLPPWQGGILPLNHSRILCCLINTRLSFRRFSKCFLRRCPDAFTYRRKRFSPSNDNS